MEFQACGGNTSWNPSTPGYNVPAPAINTQNCGPPVHFLSSYPQPPQAAPCHPQHGFQIDQSSGFETSSQPTLFQNTFPPAFISHPGTYRGPGYPVNPHAQTAYHIPFSAYQAQQEFFGQTSMIGNYGPDSNETQSHSETYRNNEGSISEAYPYNTNSPPQNAPIRHSNPYGPPSDWTQNGSSTNYPEENSYGPGPPNHGPGYHSVSQASRGGLYGIEYANRKCRNSDAGVEYYKGGYRGNYHGSRGRGHFKADYCGGYNQRQHCLGMSRMGLRGIRGGRTLRYNSGQSKQRQSNPTNSSSQTDENDAQNPVTDTDTTVMNSSEFLDLDEPSESKEEEVENELIDGTLLEPDTSQIEIHNNVTANRASADPMFEPFRPKTYIETKTQSTQTPKKIITFSDACVGTH